MKDKLKEIVDAIDWEQYIVETEDGAFFEFSGFSAVVCTGYAEELAMRILPEHFPDSHFDIVGRYYLDAKDREYPITNYCDGHDLCMMDERYVIDVWPKYVEGLEWPTVLDMEIPMDNVRFSMLYGNVNKYGKGLTA
jgi:hypothetical protein